MRKFLPFHTAPLFIVFLFAACVTSPNSRETQKPADTIADVKSDVKVFPQLLGKVNSAVFSPDGRYVLTGDSDGAVKVWDVETGEIRASYYGHEKMVLSVAWSPDGKLIASGSWDNTIRIWDAPGFAGKEREPLKHDHYVFSVAFSPDSRFVVSGSVDKTIRIWDAASGREIHIMRGHEGTIYSASFERDGKRIVSASADRTVMIWDAKTGIRIRTLRGHTDNVRSATWSPDGKRIVSASYDKTIRIWDAETGDIEQVIGKGVYDNQVLDVKFSPDGGCIVAVGGYNTDIKKLISIWETETGALLRQFSEHTNIINSFGLDSSGKRIVTASYDSTAKLYNAETGECIKTFTGKTSIIRQAVLSRDGKRLVTGDEGNKVNIWNTETGVLERSLEHSGWVYAVAISPDCRVVAAGAAAFSDQIRLWDLETGNELRILKGHRSAVFALVFNPVNGLLASASGDGTIRIWNPETGKELDLLSGHEARIITLTFSADGKRLFSGSMDRTIRIWELTETGQYRFLRRLTGHSGSVYSIASNFNGTKIVSGSLDRTARVWDIEKDRNQTLEADIYMNDMWSVAFSPDSRTIIAGSGNNEIFRWQIDDEGAYRYMGVKEKLLGVAYSISYVSNGARILAGISDGTARLYNADDLSEIACFVCFTGEDGEWLTITPDGFYRGSPQGDRFINVLINDRDLTSMDMYSDFFYRPDIVYARLMGQPDPEKPRFTIQQAAGFRPPTISILSPRPGSTVSGNGKVDISVSITDKNRPIQDIRILVNGVRLGRDELRAARGTSGITAEEGGLSVKGNQNWVQFTVPVNLVEKGNNRIEVMAFNGISWGDSNSGYTGSVNVTWQMPAAVKVPLPNLWILAVGVTGYNNAGTDKLPMSNLNFCGNDAKELVKTLTTQKGKRYKEVYSRLLIDGEIEPTAENVRSNLRFLGDAGPRDVVLLFMSGHGISEDRKFYFLTKDAVMENGKVDPNYAISDTVIKSVLDASGRRLVFIDACQSGGMDINGFMYSLRRTNAYILSSSEGDKPSFENVRWNRHGVFAYSVIKGLNGMAPRNQWGGLSVLDLSGYVKNAVLDLTREIYREQKPVQYSWGFSDFDIAR